MSNWLLYAITVMVWGTTWLAIEFQIGIVPPETSVFYRYVLASTLLFAWCLLRGQSLRFDRRAHGYFLLLGLLLFSLNYVLTYHAQQYITSAVAAIAFSTMLWLNMLNSRIFFGLRTGRSLLTGSLLGVAGITVLFLPEIRALSFSDATLFGAGLAIAGALVASLGNMVSQAAQRDGLPIVQSNAWGMLYGAILTGLSVAATGKPLSIDLSTSYLASLAYLAVFGSIVGFGSYLTLLGRIGASRAGYAMVMFPVVAILASVIAGETVLDWNLVAGSVLVLGGNFFILRSGKRPATDRVSSRTEVPGYSSSPPCQEINFQPVPSRTRTSV